MSKKKSKSKSIKKLDLTFKKNIKLSKKEKRLLEVIKQQIIFGKDIEEYIINLVIQTVKNHKEVLDYLNLFFKTKQLIKRKSLNLKNIITYIEPIKMSNSTKENKQLEKPLNEVEIELEKEKENEPVLFIKLGNCIELFNVAFFGNNSSIKLREHAFITEDKKDRFIIEDKNNQYIINKNGQLENFSVLKK